jgi:hypothetical protein
VPKPSRSLFNGPASYHREVFIVNFKRKCPRIDVGTLSGSGQIRARGGNSSYAGGAGGGGRIAIYYRDASAFNMSNVSALSGTGGRRSATCIDCRFASRNGWNFDGRSPGQRKADMARTGKGKKADTGFHARNRGSSKLIGGDRQLYSAVLTQNLWPKVKIDFY